MDWRDSNIVLGEQMNTRGYDSSRLLASHKGVGILRPDGDTQAGADVLALTVRTYYMPNEDWQIICQRGRVLRETAATLTGHAAGHDAAPVLDHAAAARAIGSGSARAERQSRAAELPEPLASIIDYLDELDSVPEFVSAADLAEMVETDPAWLGRRLGELGCRSIRERIPQETGEVRQIRGYLTADLYAAAAAVQRDGEL
jgi:S-DNA-T family DNA segregation ATPase FtsK/SpoIIIE